MTEKYFVDGGVMKPGDKSAYDQWKIEPDYSRYNDDDPRSNFYLLVILAVLLIRLIAWTI